jgi:thiamine transport system permease protein
MGIGLYLASAKRSLLLLTLYRIPIGISTVALGLGYLVTFTSGIFPFRQSWLVTPIAQSILLIPLVVQIVMPSQRAISEDIENLATMEGTDHIQYWWYVERPLLMRPILVALGYAVVISIGEFGAANFLAYGDQATLPTLLYRLISRPGALNFGMAMAASALLIALTAIITFAVDFYSLKRDRL